MKIEFIHKEENSHLILFFAGWGMDAHPFAHLSLPLTDIAVCYDYRYLDVDFGCLSGYLSIDVYAWSMGVWAASHSVGKLPIVPSLMIAINGTPYPIDDNRGIPLLIYHATKANLSEASLENFYRRMCHRKETYSHFKTRIPKRPMDELLEELENIEKFQNIPFGHVVWDSAYIALNDRIFPTSNQQRVWKDECTVYELNEAHWFDFQDIITP